MSRSTKKPFVKDPNNAWGKKRSARSYRSHVRQVNHVWLKKWDSIANGRWWFIEYAPTEEFDPVYKDRRSIIDPWDVCDYRFYWPKDPVSYRK